MQVLRQDGTFVMHCWMSNSYHRDEQFVLSHYVITTCLQLLHSINQWFSTSSLKGAKYRLTTLLESRTKDILMQDSWHVLFHCRTKSVTQNIRSFIERLLRAAQRVLGSHMRLSEQWLRTTGINGVECASGAAFEVIVVACFKCWLLRLVRWWWNQFLTDPTCRTIFRRRWKFLLSEHSMRAFF